MLRHALRPRRHHVGGEVGLAVGVAVVGAVLDRGEREAPCLCWSVRGGCQWEGGGVAIVGAVLDRVEREVPCLCWCVRGGCQREGGGVAVVGAVLDRGERQTPCLNGARGGGKSRGRGSWSSTAGCMNSPRPIWFVGGGEGNQCTARCAISALYRRQAGVCRLSAGPGASAGGQACARPCRDLDGWIEGTGK